ncbi:MAG: anaerobic ribonucleoside-triphosphate reductase activating protein [Ruminococcaceae bacterium]|nr:anaerobic ribonucleoside-triphosphate reductase activating protein [Oscillospiraceae bacterium]
MKIGGLMKLTLLDYPTKVACTVFTPHCNFRCPFCHNASLVIEGDELMSEEDFFEFLNSRRKILDGVCVSGGEPTINSDIREFIKRIKELGLCVKLDTNGSNPEVLKSLIDDGLIDYVAMDIKNSPDKYALTCGCSDMLDRVRKSVDILMQGNIDFEFRTTVTAELHTDKDFHEIGNWISGAKKYYLQSFKDSGDILSTGNSAATEGDMKRFLSIVKKYIPDARLRDIDT